MEKRTDLLRLAVLLALCFVLSGCAPLTTGLRTCINGKERCFLRTENVTQFFYRAENYTITPDTVPESALGDWIGCIHQLAAVDANGKVLALVDLERATFQTLAALSDTAPDAAYVIPFLNVYTDPDSAIGLLVSVDGAYHRAVPTPRS